MTPQLTLTIYLLGLLILWCIAWTMLHPTTPRQLATAPAMQPTRAPMIHVSADVFNIDTADSRYETIIHSAIRNGYHFSERHSGIETYVRREYHGPATW